MPRGRKSKLRAREKRHQAQAEPMNLMGAQATSGVGRVSPSSSAWSRRNQQSSATAGSTSNPQGPQRATFTTTAAAGVSQARSNGRANNQVERRPRSSQVRAATEQLPRGPIDEKVVILVHYMLYKYQRKEPIKKVDMMRDIIQMHRSHYKEILKKASEHLEMVFGLDLKEMDPNRHIYVLVNKLVQSYDTRVSDGRGVPTTGLLMTILGVIFKKGNCATEEQIWEVLNVMGLYKGRRHFIFGEPRKLITQDLVKEKYLEYQQVPNSYPPRYQFLWGPRAYAETSKMKVLEFWAKVSDTVPSAFPSWYEEALREEEEKAEARAASRAHIRAMASARSRALSTRSSPRS
ncbi:melanoma-associated antigen B10-like [Carlito syrichta]|uniref:Melanoma-associated antigen B10-like n=1 Tax=Carlito syrichta TaxID=1868482 RepID=A0A1U7T2D1_CARSF|nr:melanoma-associated antigen B10-like [Carlito syrichta]